jgi:hypothetical protein
MDLLEEEANLHEVETKFNKWKRTSKSLGGGGEVEVDFQEEKVDPYGVSTIHLRRNGLLGLRVLYTKLFLLQLSILQLVIGCH